MVATLLEVEAFTPEPERHRQRLELTVLSCDYNGWTDAPEDEREAIEAFESSSERSAYQLPPMCLRKHPPPAPQRQRKAA